MPLTSIVWHLVYIQMYVYIYQSSQIWSRYVWRKTKTSHQRNQIQNRAHLDIYFDPFFSFLWNIQFQMDISNVQKIIAEWWKQNIVIC